MKRCVVVLLAMLATSAMAQWSVPPASRPAETAKKARPVVTMRLAADAPARRITLGPPTTAERAAMKAATAAPGRPASKSRGLAIGFAREVPATERRIRLAELPWQKLPDGTQVARVELTSPGAVAVRVQLALADATDGLVLRFRGSAPAATVFGPYAAAAVVRDIEFWTPVLEGETAAIEIELPAGAEPGAAALTLPLISHLGSPGTSLKALSSYIGRAESCEVDIACLAPSLQQQLASATSAIARLLVTVKGTTYLCSGTLLNDASGSFTPYFLSANHCIAGVINPAADKGVAAAAAGTVNTYWFFQAASCGSLAEPNYVLLADGATLLARGVDYDWSLLRLNSAPPPGATFAAWNAAGPLATGTAADAIHHPAGDLKKISQGNVVGYRSYPDGSSFIDMQWSLGATEAGSSGAGLFVLNAASGIYELRGGLVGGAGTCSAVQGVDEFSRFDVAFPLVQQYLAPGASNPTRMTPVAEFYNTRRDDYFITADPSEIGALDGAVSQGWVRTGLRFLAYTDPAVAPAGVQPVCRFYLPPAYGDTHFLSASPQECADTYARYGNVWIRESTAAFYAALPDAGTGACPAATRAVYRFASTANPLRRRYTAEVDVRDSIISGGGWTQEGFGPAPDQVAMCVPSPGTSTTSPPQQADNFEGIWWADPAGSESGWGLSVSHQGDVIFLGWFTYDANGRPWWLSMTASKSGTGSYSGLLYQSAGPAFNAVPFNPNQVVRSAIGAATLTFRDAVSGTFAYAVGGVAQTKAIARVAFGAVPTCTYGAQPDFALATNYQDLWWVPGGAESGWGLALTHQGDSIVVGWYTYDLDGAPLWMSATATKAGPGVYTGTVIRTTGPAFSAVPFDPARVTRTSIGTLALAFADGNRATFTYTVNGVTQTKAITRALIAPPAGTVCQ